MAIHIEELESLLRQSFPGAEIDVRDLVGDGDHYQATVLSDVFLGKTRVQQHQMVYAALKGIVGQELHALAVKTGLPTLT
ncbi:MAG: BolA/IbaG family iron-sulfur metabolism protein [Alphaproteobacteria bacterium]|nr:BolA/IbaG family iron-sulfur metabolism protein [Alphaproteobacteria bacterium]